MSSPQSMPKDPVVVVFGAGAVGSTIGGWIAPYVKQLYFVDQGATAQALRTDGITLYCGDTPSKRTTVKVQVVEDLGAIPAKPDIIILCVKNYSLEGVSKLITDKVGKEALIVAFQNGIENQAVLPRFFARVIYGIVSYNAWIDKPGVVGYQKKGPLVLGVLNSVLGVQKELHEVASLLNQGVETIATDHLADAAYSKMIINLTNSFTTLVGHKFREISDKNLFQKLLTNLTYEGVQIVKATGYKECKLGGMPSWRTITMAAKLPLWITRPIFNKNVKKMVLSSMAQDILQRGNTDSELESLNGYFLRLADKKKLKVPYNRAVYKLCKERFGKPGFEPIDVTEVWTEVQKQMRLP